MTKHKNKKRSAALASIGLAACLVAGASYANTASSVRQNDRHHGPDRHDSSHHRDPQAAFQRMDQDSNGTISQQEFVSAHEKMAENMHAHRAQREARRSEDRQNRPDFFAKLDGNSDGNISRAEWDQGKARLKQAREQRRAAHFQHDRSERRHGPRKAHKRNHHRLSAHEIFRSIDADGDGQLSSSEWTTHHEYCAQRMRDKHRAKANND